MSNKNQWQKSCEKKLSLENLESRQLLSAVPFTASTDYVESSVACFAANDDVYVDFAVAEDAPVAAEAPAPLSPNADFDVVANGTKVIATFDAEAGEDYTVVVAGFDPANATKAPSVTVKNIKPTAKNLQDGAYTYTFSGKAGMKYVVSVAEGKFSKKDAGWVAEDAKIEFSGDTTPVTPIDNVELWTLPNVTFTETKGMSTVDTIAFELKDEFNLVDPDNNPVEFGTLLDNCTITGKFDGAKTATLYTVDGGVLAIAATGETTPYTITDLGGGKFEMGGFQQANTKQSFQLTYSTGDDGGAFGFAATSALTKNLTVSTTKEQNPVPENVAAALNDNNEIEITWTGETDLTYTVAYEATDIITGKVTTKTVNAKAKVDANGATQYEGKEVFKKLASGTIYKFTVSANKTKEFDASVLVAADTIVTPTVIPAPTLKKDKIRDTEASFQISNWDKMATALEHGSGEATITVKNGKEVVEVFTYDEDADEWTGANGGTMTVDKTAKKPTATLTVVGLDDTTDYNFTVTAESAAVIDGVINTVLPAESKPLKVTTAIPAYADPAIDDFMVTSDSVTVAWSQAEDAPSFIVTATQFTFDADTGEKVYGKTITKNVKGNSVTITGLKPNTDYEIAVAAKGDKVASESKPVTQDVKTNGKFTMGKITQVEANKYTLDFGVNMTEFSGYMEVTLTASGKVAGVSDTVAATNFVAFFGDNAGDLMTEYQAHHKNAVCVNWADGEAAKVTTKKYGYELDAVFGFVAGATESELTFTVPDGLGFDGTATLKINNATIKNNDTDAISNAKVGKSVKFTYKGN